MAIKRVDNGDGTTTFRGVSVTIKTSVADKFDVVKVDRCGPGDVIAGAFGAETISTRTSGSYVILTPRPTWKPPADLPAGIYEWREHGLFSTAVQELLIKETASKWFRSWSEPAKAGGWRVNDDGTATYLGEV